MEGCVEEGREADIDEGLGGPVGRVESGEVHFEEKRCVDCGQVKERKVKEG